MGAAVGSGAGTGVAGCAVGTGLGGAAVGGGACVGSTGSASPEHADNITDATMNANATVKNVLTDFTLLMRGVEVLFINQWMKGTLDPMPEPHKSLSAASLQIPLPVR